MDAAFMFGISGDQELAADGVRALAIEAGTSLGTGRIEAEALGVDGSRHVAGALHGAHEVAADFVEADDEENLLRALGNGRDPVGIAIDIYEHAVPGHGIGAREE